MFTQLVASRPAPQRSAGGLSASVVFHGLLAAGAVSATMLTSHPVERPVAQHLVYMPPEAPAAPAAPQDPVPVPPVVSVPVAPTAPINVPDVLPPVDPVRTLPPPPPSTLFVSGQFASPSAPLLPAGATYLAEQVEVTVALARGSPTPRFPTSLRSAGVEGTARFQFVVDTLGMVEMGTVREIQSTHPAFTVAVLGTLPRMRFTPARVGGRPVRQLVEFPVVFRMDR